MDNSKQTTGPGGAKPLTKLRANERKLLQRMVDGSRLAKRLFSENYILIENDSHHWNVQWSVVSAMRERGYIHFDVVNNVYSVSPQGRAELARHAATPDVPADDIGSGYMVRCPTCNDTRLMGRDGRCPTCGTHLGRDTTNDAAATPGNGTGAAILLTDEHGTVVGEVNAADARYLAIDRFAASAPAEPQPSDGTALRQRVIADGRLYVPGHDDQYHVADGNGGTLCGVSIEERGWITRTCDICEKLADTLWPTRDAPPPASAPTNNRVTVTIGDYERRLLEGLADDAEIDFDPHTDEPLHLGWQMAMGRLVACEFAEDFGHEDAPHYRITPAGLAWLSAPTNGSDT